MGLLHSLSNVLMPVIQAIHLRSFDPICQSAFFVVWILSKSDSCTLSHFIYDFPLSGTMLELTAVLATQYRVFPHLSGNSSPRLFLLVEGGYLLPTENWAHGLVFSLLNPKSTAIFSAFLMGSLDLKFMSPFVPSVL